MGHKRDPCGMAMLWFDCHWIQEHTPHASTSQTGKIWVIPRIYDISAASRGKVLCYTSAKCDHRGTLGKMYITSRCVISYNPCWGIYNYLHKNSNKKEGEKRGKQKFLLEIACDREPDGHRGCLQKLKNPGARKLTNSSHREMTKAQV